MIEINQSTAERNFSICYASYCYFWNGEISLYELLKPCPEAHWILEIYDEGVQSEVLEFISSIHENNSKLPLMGYYVPLNLICTNSTTCIWKHANRSNFNSIDFQKYLFLFYLLNLLKFVKINHFLSEIYTK